MRKAIWAASLVVGLASTAAYADCASDIQRLQSSGRLTPQAQSYLDKAKQSAEKKTHGERDCESWVDSAYKEMRTADRRYSDRAYDRRDDPRDDPRYDRRDDPRYDRRDDPRYDPRYDRSETRSGSSNDALGRILNGIGSGR
jgi:hypothetical protein